MNLRGLAAVFALVASPLVAQLRAQTPASVPSNGAQTSGVSPSFVADLDGDGIAETVVAIPARGSVRIEIRDAGGRRLAEAKSAAPPGDVVPVTLTSEAASDPVFSGLPRELPTLQ